MNDADLIKAVRIAARIPDTHPDYPDDRIRQELTDAMRTVFAEPIKSAGNGYGQQLATELIVAGKEVYRIPPRAFVGGLVTVEAEEPGGTIRTIVERTQRDLAEQIDPGEPHGYVDNADFLRLVPVPNTAGFTLRQWYKVRPSQIVENQAEGRITAVDPVARTVDINAVPKNRITDVLIATNDLVDIIPPDGSHELHLVSRKITLAGLQITFPVGTDMTRLAVGDLVRSEDQCEFATMLPEEYNRTLADAAATVILSDIGTAAKAAVLANKVVADINRMTEAMEPRVRDQATPFKPRYGPLRAFRRWSPPARI